MQRILRPKKSAIVITISLLAAGGCGDPSTTNPNSREETRVESPPADPKPSAGGWVVDSSYDEMDKVTNVTLTLVAENPRALLEPARALVVRCQKKETSVYVVTQEPVDSSFEYNSTRSYTKVRYRIDGTDPAPSSWTESTNLVAIFSPDPIALAKRLAGANELLFEYKPYGSVARTLKFHVDGLQNVLPKVASACNWKSTPSQE